MRNRLPEKGVFSDLDVHFARLMAEMGAEDSSWLYLAAALASRATCQGHVCLDLAAVAGRPLVDEEGRESGVVLPELEAWVAVLHKQPVVGAPGDFRPLILDAQGRLYLHRYWEYERDLAGGLLARAADFRPLADPAAVQADLSGCFALRGESDWQAVAAGVAAFKGLCIVTGGPGTGKSTVVSRILALARRWKPDLRLALAAPTGKAAARLTQAVGEGLAMLPAGFWEGASPPAASTLHRLLGMGPGSAGSRFDERHPLPLDLVVVDEASMVDVALMARLVRALPSPARIVLLGDRDQLASVEAGAVLGDLCAGTRLNRFSAFMGRALEQATGCRLPETGGVVAPVEDCIVELTFSYRFGSDSGIGRASRAVRDGKGDLAWEVMAQPGSTALSREPLPPPDGLQARLETAVKDAFGGLAAAASPGAALTALERFRILCAVRKGPYGVEAVNRAVEEILRRSGLIASHRRFYAGRPVLVTRNSYPLGLFNGDLGVVLPDPEQGGDLRAFFRRPDGSIRKILPLRLPEHETAYAMTVHKSQGSEFDRILLVLPERPLPVLTRELVYTGLTRARAQATVFCDRPVFLQAVTRRVERASGLRDALWKKGDVH